jgi:hypothetical protein
VAKMDTSTPQAQLFQRLGHELFERQPKIERLRLYYRGDPPLPEGIGTLRDNARDFFRTSRTNFAELVCEAPRERMKPIGVRITTVGAGNDEDGDQVAWDAWNAANLPILNADVHESMLSLRDGYVIVAPNPQDPSRPVVTAEDPSQVVTLHDPMTDEITSGLKVYRDHDAKQDVAFMYRPGQVFVATRPASRVTDKVAHGAFQAGDWEWDPARSGPLPDGFEDVVPVVRFRNRAGVAEFERHIDLLDRINRMTLREMVIATYQAFRQRAAMGSFPEKDDQGNLIDYSKVFEAGPDALWLMPPDAQLWESGQVDLGGIQATIKQDVLFLAAVTRTPLAMLTPDAAAQSAEGASLQREGLVFKTEDRIARASQSWSKVVALMFRYMGDAARSKPEAVQMIWSPVERYSMSERANAIAQTKDIIPRYQQYIEVWGMTPAQARRAAAELADDRLLDQQFAAAVKASQGVPAGAAG